MTSAIRSSGVPAAAWPVTTTVEPTGKVPAGPSMLTVGGAEAALQVTVDASTKLPEVAVTVSEPPTVPA